VQLRALASVCRIEHVRVWDGDFERARQFAEEQAIELGLPIEAVPSPSEALRDSDVAATCTPSRSFYVRESDLSPGGFLAAVGADSPEKQEIDPFLISQCRLVVDVLEQCASIGELLHAIDAGLLTRPQVHADLAQLVSGSRPGRTSSQERFVFDSTGTALEDVAAAAAVYAKAVACGAGVPCQLGL
jgi:alanine dehydrogenase